MWTSGQITDVGELSDCGADDDGVDVPNTNTNSTTVLVMYDQLSYRSESTMEQCLVSKPTVSVDRGIIPSGTQRDGDNLIIAGGNSQVISSPLE